MFLLRFAAFMWAKDLNSSSTSAFQTLQAWMKPRYENQLAQIWNINEANNADSRHFTSFSLTQQQEVAVIKLVSLVVRSRISEHPWTALRAPYEWALLLTWWILLLTFKTVLVNILKWTSNPGMKHGCCKTERAVGRSFHLKGRWRWNETLQMKPQGGLRWQTVTNYPSQVASWILYFILKACSLSLSVCLTHTGQFNMCEQESSTSSPALWALPNGNSIMDLCQGVRQRWEELTESLKCSSYPWGQSGSPPVSPHRRGPWGGDRGKQIMWYNKK